LSLELIECNSRKKLEFLKFAKTFKKSYSKAEFSKRFEIFSKNVEYIEAHNKKNLSFFLKINEFADLTNQEFVKIYNGMKLKKPLTPVYVEAPTNVTEFGWRKKGAVTQIKNQGQCGSCWSFSTTGSTEGCHFITTNKLVSLSEQNLMDCSYQYGNQGCEGGLMVPAMEYIINNNGIDTESSYPYQCADGDGCLYTVANRGATLKGYSNVISGNESSLYTHIFKGPVSVAIDASHNSFQFYGGGIYYEPACSPTNLDHGVLVVGFGEVKYDFGSIGYYWEVKNSWGESWGDDGYIKMSRNRHNNCGIASSATLPLC